jgi:hypothetical protein
MQKKLPLAKDLTTSTHPRFRIYQIGEEIGQGFTPSDLQSKDQTNLTLEEINEGPRLKDDVAFTLLIMIFPHMVIIFNDLDNPLGLNLILNASLLG